VKHHWLIFLFCLANQAFAQDIHWTQFNNNPIFQNPAGAGNFKEDIRLTANYRTQLAERQYSFPNHGSCCRYQMETMGLYFGFTTITYWSKFFGS